MRNFFTVGFGLLLAIASLVLAVLACFGSYKNEFPLNDIYAAQLNLSGFDVESLLNLSTNVTDSSLGLSDTPSYINLGLWSYCTLDSSKTITQCTSQSGMNTFNLQDTLENIFSSSIVEEIISEIFGSSVPSDISSYTSSYNALLKCMCICLAIGIGLTCLCFVAFIVRMILHLTFVNVAGRVISLLAFISIAVSASTGTAAYVIIRRVLNDNVEDYGISLTLGKNFYGLLWGSVASSLLTFVLWCLTRQRTKVVYVQPSSDEKY